MANLNINLTKLIHAEITVLDSYTFINSPLIIDPLTKSYSDYAPLVYYNLELIEVSGLENPILLENGKNSRFTAQSNGSCKIQLTIEDEQGNTDTDTITVDVI